MEAIEKSEMTSQETMNAEFCQKHLALQKKSGLSIKKYCKITNIHYTRFLYWARKASFVGISASDSSIPLIAVKLKNKNEPPISAEVMCTLSLKNETLLKVHTLEALSFILERMG